MKRFNTKTKRAYTPKTTKEYEEKVRMFALKARAEARQEMAMGPVITEIALYGPVTGDNDNYEKATKSH